MALLIERKARLDKNLDKAMLKTMEHHGFSLVSEYLRHLIHKDAKFAGFIDYDNSRRSQEQPLSL